MSLFILLALARSLGLRLLNPLLAARFHGLLAAGLLTASCASGSVSRAGPVARVDGAPVTLQDTFQFDLDSTHTG
ncbi:hypothetical protein [Myxococcus xanthus]|uniref:hypothetical protein n=1 Tax=Myxococcus xanthus TaxID=34 RepID=UPI0020A3FA89|nr:hypothetical protein [Myxococcus xanthus]